ncbi:MAG: hypothetical protein IH892_21510 [Planctomycetes bacterium]|nr:hypothetical protein [Planctomycetota bacterium]
MLSKTSKSVVNALVELAKLPAGSYEGASSIAKRIGAPKNYLGKLLQKRLPDCLSLAGAAAADQNSAQQQACLRRPLHLL